MERNLADKLPSTLPAFRLIVDRCLHVVPDPSTLDLEPYQGQADLKDLPLRVAAHRENCPWLVTFNPQHAIPTPSTKAHHREGAFGQAGRQPGAVTR